MRYSLIADLASRPDEKRMPEKLIFISYSHDSDEHREKVLGLAERLRLDGLDAQVDQYVEGTPEETWPRWMLDRLDEAAFVLVVCTETYYRRFRGHEVPGRGKGVDWEGALINQEIYHDKSRTVRFVPVLLSAGQERYIPEPLRGHTHYELTSEKGYQALYAFLLGQAGVQPAQLGDLKPVSKRAAQPLTFGPAPDPAPTMIGVPHRNPFFTGREPLLAKLHQQLQTTGITALAQAAIHGLGGIGKTQTAIEYAHRFGTSYRFVLWVRAEQEAEIGAAYLSIARDLGLVEEKADLETAVQALKAWLSHEDGWLLVFDNADDPALLRAYLPVTRTGGKVLLTSRAKIFADVGIREPFRVETMDPDDAIAFLFKRTKRDEAGPAAELAQALDYLPLALEQAAAYVDTVGVSLSDYLASFRRRGLKLLEKGKPGAEYPASVATTWNLAVTNIKKASPASSELLTAAAFLVPDSIPIEIFTLGGSELGDLLAEALKGVDEDPLIFWELLTPLERYSLVERLPDDAFKLHRLTQEVIKDSLGEEGRQAWAERVVRALDAAYPWPEFENWELCERLQPNARVASELTRTYKLESAESGRLFNEAGYFAWERGDYASAKLLIELALEIIESVRGSEHPNTLSSRNNLAEILYDLGDLAGARKLHEQTLEARERVLGSEHPDTLISRNNLAEILYNLGEPSGAKKLHKQTLEIQERVLGGEHPDTLQSRNNLAETLRALGDLAGARKLHEQNCESFERELGDEHPNTLTSRNNLAWTLYEQGERQTARELMARVVEGRRRVLGEEHPWTQGSIESLRQFEDEPED
jgi:hypothetical protein